MNKSENTYLQIYDILKSNFEFTKDVQQIMPEDNLMDFGLDSISMVKVVVIIEEIYNISIPDEDLLFENFNSIEKITQYIQEHIII